ncbi:hypothetical protein, partial [Alcanivorax sp. HI0003]|uniref:hypothetical protein n=1 Tax=Alcanivorax sp. HI0003 TaxID=1822217 RepID=UPI001E44CA96
YGHTAHVQNFFGVLVGKPWTAHISLGNKQEQQETYRRSLMLSQNLITRPGSIAPSGLDLATLDRCWRRYVFER